MNVKLVSVLLFFFTSLTFSYSQENGDILSKTLIPKDSLLVEFSKSFNPQLFITSENENIDWSESWKHLDSLNIFNITYYSDGLKVNGYMIEPRPKGKYPCVIYNRGGNREFGMLSGFNLALQTSMIARKGYVIIASNYRGNGGGEGNEEFGGNDVNDVLNLISSLSKIEKADTSKIGMFGWSRGGMMTYIALTKTDRIKAAVVGGAISDNFKLIQDRKEMETNVLSELIPNYEQTKELSLKKRSAIKWVDKFPTNVPILIMHGGSDWRVKPEHSLELAIEFEKYRIPYRLIIFEGANHGIYEFWRETDQNTVAWFEKYLKDNTALPNMEYHGR